MKPWAGVVALVPVAAVLAVDPWGLAPFGPLKWALVPALVLAGLVSVARKPRLDLARRPTLVWVVFLVLVAAAAAGALDPFYAWLGTPERRFGVLAWLLCALAFVTGQAADEPGARWVAGAAVATAGLMGMWTVAEHLGWQPVDLTGAGQRPVGPVGSSAYLGAAAALLVPAALGMAIDRDRSTNVRRLAGAATMAGAAALLLSGARAAWVGTTVACVLAAVLLRRHLGRRRVAVTAGLAIAVVVAFGAATGGAARLIDAVSDGDGGARGRIDEWRVAVRVIADHPLTGVGPEGYRIAFGRSVDTGYEQAHGRTPLPDRAHSALLDVAATTGLPGLAAYATLLALVGRLVLRALREEPAWVAGIAAGLVAYAVQSLFLFPIAELDPVAWLLAGVVAGRVMVADETLSVSVPRPVPALAGMAAAVALIAGVLDVAADRSARATLAFVARGRPTGPGAATTLRPDQVRYHLVAARAHETSLAAGGQRRALQEIGDALDLSPHDPVVLGEQARLLLDRARTTKRPADIRAANDALEQLAGDDARNAEVMLRLGLARALADDHAGAEQAWLAAELLAPRSSAGSTNLALAYAEAGRWAEARAAAQRALARNPDDTRAQDVLERANGT